MNHEPTNSSNDGQEGASSEQSGAALTDAQVKGLVALLSEPTLQDAAKVVGVNPSTIWRWQQQPEFAQAYREARRDAVTQGIARLQHATGEAVKTLLAVMREAGAGTAAPRVSAARAVLEFSLKATEIEDLADRVAALERIAAQMGEAGTDREV